MCVCLATGKYCQKEKQGRKKINFRKEMRRRENTCVVYRTFATYQDRLCGERDVLIEGHSGKGEIARRGDRVCVCVCLWDRKKN